MPKLNVPCLPGDKVYVLLQHTTGGVSLYETNIAVISGSFTESSTKFLLRVKFPFLLSDGAPNSLDYFTEDIGKTIFLSLEEAEEEIKRRYKPNEQTISNGYTLTHTYFNPGFSPSASPLSRNL